VRKSHIDGHHDEASTFHCPTDLSRRHALHSPLTVSFWTMTCRQPHSLSCTQAGIRTKADITGQHQPLQLVQQYRPKADFTHAVLVYVQGHIDLAGLHTANRGVKTVSSAFLAVYKIAGPSVLPRITPGVQAVCCLPCQQFSRPACLVPQSSFSQQIARKVPRQPQSFHCTDHSWLRMQWLA